MTADWRRRKPAGQAKDPPGVHLRHAAKTVRLPAAQNGGSPS